MFVLINMTEEGCMRSFLIKSSIFVSFLAALLPLQLFSQPQGELERFRQKYPENSLIYELEQKDVTVEMKKGVPVIHIREYSSRYLLQDNSTKYSDFKYYYNSRTEPSEIKAYSLVPAGKDYRKIPAIETSKVAEFDDGVFYDDTHACNFNFSSAAAGTRLVIESQTTISDLDQSINFYFKRYSPIEKAVISIRVPNEVNLRFKLFGNKDTSLVRFTTEVHGNKTIYSWKAENMKGYDSDKEAPDSRYYTPHLIIRIGGYEKSGKFIPVLSSIADLYRSCYKNLKDTSTLKKGPVKNLADSLTAGISNEEAKVNSVFQWVQQKIRYVAFEDGSNGLVPCDPDTVALKRYGDCKGKTSLLVNLLRSAGIRAGYAWIGTRAIPYPPSIFPAPCCFNHMVAVWWKGVDEPVILDGTTQYHALYETPASLQGKECLVEKGPTDFKLFIVPLAPPSFNTCTDSLKLAIRGELAEGNGTSILKTEIKATFLNALNKVDSMHYRDIVASIFPRASNKFLVGKVSTSDLSSSIQDLRISYNFNLPGYVTRNKDRLYINLNLDRMFENLDVDEDRIIPVESEQTIDNLFTSSLKIPESYVPEAIPGPVSFSNPEFGFTQKYTLDGDQLKMTNRIIINFHVIEGDQLKEFSHMLAALRKAYSNSVVLIKK